MDTWFTNEPFIANNPVKLVFVRNRNKHSEYIVLLSTDCTLSNEEIVRTYGNRWSIELFFRVSKSLLYLGSEFQGLSYDMTVSSTALKQLMEILVNGLGNQMITITSEIKSQLINWFVSQPAFIQALCPDFGWEV